MPLIKDHPVRWEVWNAIFLSITVFKRDKLEEIESSLMPIYYEFALQLQDADFNDLLKISNNMMTSDKLISYVNGCKVNLLIVIFCHFYINFFLLLTVLCIEHNCDVY